MSEQIKDSIFQKQKNIRPKIEEVIGDALEGDVLENALNLVTYLRGNRMNPQWTSANSWKISYKTYAVCYMRFNSDAGTLNIQPFICEYEDDSLPDDMKKIVWANKKPCCGRCSLKISVVFGKEYDNACERSFVFSNPDANTVECIKKLLEMRRNAIREGKAKSRVYVAMKNR